MWVASSGSSQRLLGQVVALAPADGAAPQFRDQAGLHALQLGEQHIPEQVMVAVPLPSPVQRPPRR